MTRDTSLQEFIMCCPLEEKDLTRLSFLVNALAYAPDQAARLFPVIDMKGAHPSFINTVKALKEAVTDQFTPKPKDVVPKLQEIARLLRQSQDPPAQLAGHMLAREISNMYPGHTLVQQERR